MDESYASGALEESTLNPAIPLPIDGVLNAVADALGMTGAAVLRAPPGAGKTTRVPLSLLGADWLRGARIIMLEPRRLAARAAAGRMAWQLGQQPGGTVGYRTRLDTRVSGRTRIEVVTEGVLTRMLQQDPSLDGVGIVIFDEFHERSVHADLGLALALQAKTLFRPDLRLLVMSATIEGDPVARLLGGAPLIASKGRSWPVETHWSTAGGAGHIEARVAQSVRSALASHDGDVLAFLPGAAEIRRCEGILASADLSGVDIHPLFGQLTRDAQDRALAPSPAGRRKVVLATSIAETSLTIEGVRIVVDGGYMRVPRFSPRTGMSRLETIRVTRAAADQRTGRAGRTAPGVCYRLWSRSEDAGLVPHRTPEILETDLAPLALDLAVWGVSDPKELSWLDAPPPAAWDHAVRLLQTLHAVDGAGAVTAHGRSMASVGLHPRLAHMLLLAHHAGALRTGARVAAIISERDVFNGAHGRNPDLRLRVDAVHSGRDFRADPAAVQRVRRDAEHWQQRVAGAAPVTVTIPMTDDAGSTGALVALAYPDRIAQRRAGTSRYLLRNGRGAFLDDAGAFGDAEFLAIAALDDAGREARILMAAPIDRVELEQLFASDIRTQTTAEWDDASGSVRVMRTRALDAITFDQVRLQSAEGIPYEQLVLGAIARDGIAALPWSPSALELRQRVEFARSKFPDAWPDFSDAALLRTLDLWLAPFIAGARRRADVDAAKLSAALDAMLPWDRARELDVVAPADIAVPSGSRIPIDYSDPSSPVLAVRIQELFGLAETPVVAHGAVPLTLHLLSPARRPVQITRDLAGFWAKSYFDVRKDLRGRYPKHSWPDDPLSAPATRRTRRH